MLTVAGEGSKDTEGKVTKPNVSVGATVLYSKYSGTEFEVRHLIESWCSSAWYHVCRGTS